MDIIKRGKLLETAVKQWKLANYELDTFLEYWHESELFEVFMEDNNTLENIKSNRDYILNTLYTRHNLGNNIVCYLYRMLNDDNQGVIIFQELYQYFKNRTYIEKDYDKFIRIEAMIKFKFETEFKNDPNKEMYMTVLDPPDFKRAQIPTEETDDNDHDSIHPSSPR
jgi:hypothetical protein